MLLLAPVDVRAQGTGLTTPPSWQVQEMANYDFSFQGAYNQTPLQIYESAGEPANFSINMQSPDGPSSPTGTGSAYSTAVWNILYQFEDSAGNLVTSAAPPVIVEMDSSVSAGADPQPGAMFLNHVNDAFGGSSDASPTAAADDTRYFVYKPSNGQFTVGPLNMKAQANVIYNGSTGGKIFAGGTLSGLLFNYPTVTPSPLVTTFFSKGPGGKQVIDVPQPTGVLSIDLGMPVVQLSVPPEFSKSLSIVFQDDTDDIASLRPFATQWQVDDTASQSNIPSNPVPSSPSSGILNTHAVWQMYGLGPFPEVTLTTTAPVPAPGNGMGTTTITTTESNNRNAKGITLPDMTNSLVINWHQPIENLAVVANGPTSGWQVFAGSSQVTPVPIISGSVFNITANLSKSSDIGIWSYVSPSVISATFSVLAALPELDPLWALGFTAVSAGFSIAPPGANITMSFPFDLAWQNASGLSTWLTSSGPAHSPPAGAVETAWHITSVGLAVKYGSVYEQGDCYVTNFGTTTIPAVADDGYQGLINLAYKGIVQVCPIATFSEVPNQ